MPSVEIPLLTSVINHALLASALLAQKIRLYIVPGDSRIRMYECTSFSPEEDNQFP